MGRQHFVRDGESLGTIGARYGLLPETIWQDGGNAALREKRANPSVLRSGDIVSVPDARPKTLSVATGERHRFRRKGVPLKLDLKLVDPFGEPRANLPFTLIVEGVAVEGTTDGDGHVMGWVPARAKTAELRVEHEIYDLALHWLDPVDSEAGLCARLVNLGLLDPEHADDDDIVASAIRQFQHVHDLDATGEADDATQAKLVEAHRS